jgi:hypothetical protein
MKVLFITSHDFGELSLATFFARNQPFQKVFVIPESRATYFDEVVDIMYVYSSVVQLKKIIEKEVPDVISLNTAYLMVNGNLATMDEFTSFFQYLKQLGCPIITTDPFVRVYDSYPECSFELNGEPLVVLKKEMTFLNDYLKDLPHIYGFPCTNNHENANTFYNNNYCPKEKNLAATTEKIDRWLLVLGEIDFNLLLAKHGETFIIELVNRLKEICQNTNNLVRCVFPKNLTDIVKDPLAPIKNLQILNFVTLKEFENLVSESDIVFYWNVFSNSMMMCCYYDIPFLCFEKGHIAELSVDLFKHMSDGVYRNGNPEFIDFFSPIESNLDVVLKNHYSTENRQRILNEYHSLPTPESIIKRLTND